MEEFAAELMSKLDNKASFTIPYAGGIPVPESVVVTWVIMGIIMILTLVFVRNLKLVPTGTQNYVESLVEFLNHFFAAGGLFRLGHVGAETRNKLLKLFFLLLGLFISCSLLAQC